MASYYRRLAEQQPAEAAKRAGRLAAIFEQLARDAMAKARLIAAGPVPVLAFSSASKAAARDRTSAIFFRWWPGLAAALAVCLVAVVSLRAIKTPTPPGVALAGIVTDSFCGQHHSASSGVSCVRNCIRHGAKYSLYDGTSLYEFVDQRVGDRFAAQKVNVTGTLDRITKTLRVTSIRPAS